MNRSARSIALAGSLVLVVPGPAAGSPAPARCPFFNPALEFFSRPYADPGLEVGAFGSINQRLTGLGLDVTGDVLTVTIQVEEMKKQVEPGFRATQWIFEPKLGAFDDPWDDHQNHPWMNLIATYDLPEDRFSYWVEGPTVPDTPVMGDVRMGPGGSISISAPFEKMGVEPGSVLSGLGVVSGGRTEQPYPQGGGFHMSSARWFASGGAFFPLIPCPGAVLRTQVDPEIPRMEVEAWALPQEAVVATIEALDAGAWRPLAPLTLDEHGHGSDVVEMVPGAHTVRLRVPTRDHGDVVSEPQILEIA